MADYPSRPSGAGERRDSVLDAAESAALNPKPAAPAAPAPSTPAPAQPSAAPTLMDRIKKVVGLKDGGSVPMTYGGFDAFKKGGKVSGPGTSTSDSIPARLSKGEYVLPADTVKKVGAKNLDALRKGTHNPANRTPMRAKHKPGSRGM